MKMIDAHEQKTTLRILEFFPAHDEREGDPHYAAFRATRARLQELGKLVCWVCGATQGIELHHNSVEFALANGIDLTRFHEKFPEFAGATQTEEAFLAWVESEGNLLALCVDHHRGPHGIHCLPFPCWRALAIWRDGLELPGRLA